MGVERHFVGRRCKLRNSALECGGKILEHRNHGSRSVHPLKRGQLGLQSFQLALKPNRVSDSPTGLAPVGGSVSSDWGGRTIVGVFQPCSPILCPCLVPSGGGLGPPKGRGRPRVPHRASSRPMVGWACIAGLLLGGPVCMASSAPLPMALVGRRSTNIAMPIFAGAALGGRGTCGGTLGMGAPCHCSRPGRASLGRWANGGVGANPTTPPASRWSSGRRARLSQNGYGIWIH